MKVFIPTAALIAAFFLAACAEVSPRFQQPEAFDALADLPPAYIVGPGDELSVVFPFNAELNYEGPVGPDSNFTLPVAGTVSTAGKTTTQVEEAISRALTERKIARDASVSISIRRYAQVVYVGGEVRQPGAIPLQNKMDPLQAVIAAGGALDTARTSQAVIIRRGADGKPLLRVVNLDKLISTGDKDQAIALRPLDSIFIPKTSIAEANLWVDQYINKIIPFQRSFSYSINSQNPAATAATAIVTPP